MSVDPAYQVAAWHMQLARHKRRYVEVWGRQPTPHDVVVPSPVRCVPNPVMPLDLVSPIPRRAPNLAQLNQRVETLEQARDIIRARSDLQVHRETHRQSVLVALNRLQAHRTHVDELDAALRPMGAQPEAMYTLAAMAHLPHVVATHRQAIQQHAPDQVEWFDTALEDSKHAEVLIGMENDTHEARARRIQVETLQRIQSALDWGQQALATYAAELEQPPPVELDNGIHFYVHSSCL